MPRQTSGIAVLIGTRPEAVKLMPVVRALAAAGQPPSVWVTGQHREMLEPILAELDLRAEEHLQVMRPGQSLVDLSARVLTATRDLVARKRPRALVVEGDTTSVAMGALAAYYEGVGVAHVEAGLRTGDKYQPFPEEINRRVLGAVGDLHFAPTHWASDNLLREGIPQERIVVTGNTVIDALHDIVERPIDLSQGSLAGLDNALQIILVTAHRRENFGGPMARIFQALRTIADEYSGRAYLIYPVHLNPNVQEPAHRLLGDVPNIRLIEPLDYLSMVHLMKRAHLILTDSGGIQEEAPALGKPVLVLREVTERPEALQAGTAILVGTDTERIVQETRRLMDDPEAYAAMARAVNPFGDGHAAERIVEALLIRHASLSQ